MILEAQEWQGLVIALSYGSARPAASCAAWGPRGPVLLARRRGTGVLCGTNGAALAFAPGTARDLPPNTPVPVPFSQARSVRAFAGAAAGARLV